MLGFLDLSGSCAKLEAVLNSDEDVTECFEEVRETCQQALTEIAVKMNRPGDLLKSARGGSAGLSVMPLHGVSRRGEQRYHLRLRRAAGCRFASTRLGRAGAGEFWSRYRHQSRRLH